MRPSIIRPVLVLLCLALVRANAQATEQTAAASWFKLDAGPFSILAPSGWEFHKLRSVDSFVGEFVGDGISLRFDFGRYSDGYISSAKKSKYVVDHRSIGGFPATIASPRVAGQGITGVYFRHVDRDRSNSLFLWGQDLSESQQNLVLKVFETIRFGRGQAPDPIPPPGKDTH